MNLSEEITGPVEGQFRADTYIAEAEFGLSEIWRSVDSLDSGEQVLEIGSGPGLLLSELAKRRPDLNFTGVEPFGSGFHYFEQLSVSLQGDYNFEIEPVGYEDFNQNQNFDLIFLVNVFEHLPDWRHFLQFVKARLTPDGKCVVLCPNYAFPYESHFGIPILFSKRLTRHVFGQKIREFEEVTHTQGLWSSLNFVTAGEVERACIDIGINVEFDSGVTGRMIDRLQHDPNFADRHGFLGGMAKFVNSMGVSGVLKLPGMHRVQPYMRFELAIP